jgi:hypothetical protein
MKILFPGMSVELRIVAYGSDGRYLHGVDLEIYWDAISWLLSRRSNDFPFNFLSSGDSTQNRSFETGPARDVATMLSSLQVEDFLGEFDGQHLERLGLYPAQSGFWVSGEVLLDLREVLESLVAFGNACMATDVGSILVSF